MLRGIAYKEEMIFSCLQHSGHTLLGNDATALDESEQETLNFVLGNQRKGVRTTVSNLIEKFERKPYGWYYAAILCHVAKLRARDKIEIRSEGNLLEDLTEIDQVLRNSRLHENIILEPQLEFTASQIRALKEFYAEFFDCPCPAAEAKAIAKEVQEKFKQINQELTVLVESDDKYPFLRALCPAITTLDDICTKSSAWYLTDLCRQEDALLDIKEQTIEPIRGFMRGPQKEIYREARQLLDEQKPNLDYIAGELPRQIAEVLNDDRCFAGNRIQQVKEWVESVREQLTARVREEIYHSRERIEVFRQRLVIMEEFARLSEVQQQELTRPFEEYSESLSQEKLIAVIRDRTGRFETETYSELFSRLTAPTDSYAVNAGAYKAGEPKTEYISSRSLLVNFSKPWLENEEDVEKYLGAMKEALLAEIQQGKRVQI
jgi:sulfur relay (sulfurtransferase) DsrC/TusE family protein